MSGAAYADVVTHDGKVHDLERIAYLDGYLDAVEEALAAGANVRGYFAWSLLDNFEWSLGYRPTFGLVAVDRATFARRPKPSLAWLGGVAQARALHHIDLPADPGSVGGH